MTKNKPYKVKLKEMPAQTTRHGNTKLDANGEPLRSVQVIQSPEQKREMLDWMLRVSRLYAEFPELFPEGKHQVGNDPKKYTVQDMQEDFLSRHDKWKMLSSAHIYKSFIDRHNWMVDNLVDELHAREMYDEVRYVLDNYYIRFWTSMQERMSESIKRSGLFH